MPPMRRKDAMIDGGAAGGTARSRRQVLAMGGGATLAATALLRPAMGLAADALAAPGRAGGATPDDGQLAFDVFRGPSPMGRHVLRFTSGPDRLLTVEIAIDLAVSLGPVTVFRYTHRNREDWRDGRLISIATTTDDDGTRFTVNGRAEGGRFIVDGDQGRIEAPADILPTSYWHPETISRPRWLDTQRGRLITPLIAPLGAVERPAPGGGDIKALAYAVSGDLAMTLWYGRAVPRWLGVAFDGRGRMVTYRLARGSAPSPGRLAAAGI